MSQKTIPSNHPVRNLASIFKVRRDLVREIERTVLLDCELPIDMMDVLIELYGAVEFGWDEPKANSDGFVTVRALRESLVHSGALLSMRLKKLKAGGYLEIQEIPKTGPAAQHRQGVRSSRSWVRILPAGVKEAEKVWGRYQKLSERLLANVPQRKLEDHIMVNDTIRKNIIG